MSSDYLNKLDFPLSLLITGKDSNEQDFIAHNILKFFNLVQLNNKSNNYKNVEIQILNLIEHFNFIRMSPDKVSNSYSNIFNTSSSRQIEVPSFSCILLTNNSIPFTKYASDSDNLSQWNYHHKVELTDKNGIPIAQQLFYRLSNTLPLFSRSNWVPPTSIQTHSPINLKYIIRLNINCKNYDLMLFFYRLLFDKCSNYSKKDFSLFILKTSEFQNFSIEYQLSLKNDKNVSVQNSHNQYLIYAIKDREVLENIIRLLDGFIEELITGQVYCVSDPDRNKIYLIDNSLCNSNLSIFPLTSSIGLASKFFQKNQFFNPKLNNSFLNSPNSSSDSGNWSCSAKSSNESFLKNYKKIHKIKSNEIIDNNYNENSEKFVGVKNLIIKFTNNKNINDDDKKEDRLRARSVSRLCSSHSSLNRAENNENELDFYLKQAANNNNYLLIRNMTPVNKDKKIEEVNVKNHLRNRRGRRREDSRGRSQLNRSYINLSSSSGSSINSLSTSSPNLNNLMPKSSLTSSSRLSRKKSKSVTFIDSLPKQKQKQEPNEFKMNSNQNLKDTQRPKSTLPFRYEQSSLIDDDSEECFDLFTQSYNYLDKFNKQNFNSRPQVGITPETRHRKTHTLDLIRSTKMPLKQNQINTSYKNIPTSLNSSFVYDTRSRSISKQTQRSSDLLNQSLNSTFSGFSHGKQSQIRKNENLSFNFNHEPHNFKSYIPVAKF